MKWIKQADKIYSNIKKESNNQELVEEFVNSIAKEYSFTEKEVYEILTIFSDKGNNWNKLKQIVNEMNDKELFDIVNKGKTNNEQNKTS